MKDEQLEEIIKLCLEKSLEEFLKVSQDIFSKELLTNFLKKSQKEELYGTQEGFLKKFLGDILNKKTITWEIPGELLRGMNMRISKTLGEILEGTFKGFSGTQKHQKYFRSNSLKICCQNLSYVSCGRKSGSKRLFKINIRDCEKI